MSCHNNKHPCSVFNDVITLQVVCGATQCINIHSCAILILHITSVYPPWFVAQQLTCFTSSHIIYSPFDLFLTLKLSNRKKSYKRLSPKHAVHGVAHSHEPIYIGMENLAYLNNLRDIQLGTLAQHVVGPRASPSPSGHVAHDFLLHPPFSLGKFILHLPKHCVGRLGLKELQFGPYVHLFYSKAQPEVNHACMMTFSSLLKFVLSPSIFELIHIKHSYE